MALSAEEQAYQAKHQMARLTFDGVNDLYQHRVYGAYTIKDCIELDALQAKRPRPAHNRTADIQVSDELMRRHEQCVETYGCGML